MKLSRLPPSAVFYILDQILEHHGDDVRAWLATVEEEGDGDS